MCSIPGAVGGVWGWTILEGGGGWGLQLLGHLTHYVICKQDTNDILLLNDVLIFILYGTTETLLFAI